MSCNLVKCLNSFVQDCGFVNGSPAIQVEAELNVIKIICTFSLLAHFRTTIGSIDFDKHFHHQLLS